MVTSCLNSYRHTELRQVLINWCQNGWESCRWAFLPSRMSRAAHTCQETTVAHELQDPWNSAHSNSQSLNRAKRTQKSRHRSSGPVPKPPHMQEAKKTRIGSGHHKYKTRPAILVLLLSVRNTPKLGWGEKKNNKKTKPPKPNIQDCELRDK